MFYFIYIGNNDETIYHFSRITGGMFIAVSDIHKAGRVIGGISERYNIIILYEQTTCEVDKKTLVSFTGYTPEYISYSSLPYCSLPSGKYISNPELAIRSLPRLMKKRYTRCLSL